MTLASLTIDLDSLYCYRQIYGLAESKQPENDVYELALDRFADLLDRFGFKGTLFCVARDLEMGTNARTLRQLAKNGHEIASHSLTHNYRLSRLDAQAIETELLKSKEMIEEAIGQPVHGFRAPGYNLAPAFVEGIRNAGYVYDASVFPATPYYLAKAAILPLLKARGRNSQSILGSPFVLAAPTEPYRMGTPYWRRGNGLAELPISVVPGLRLPMLGSLFTLGGWKLVENMLRLLLATKTPHVHVEFHGVDFLDGPGDGLAPELLAQPDLAVPWSKKREALLRFFDALFLETEVLPLRDVVSKLLPEISGNSNG